MNVREIIIKYLDENGFDGLVNPGLCGCSKDEICLCEGINDNECQPAYKRCCVVCSQKRNCELYSDGAMFCYHPERLK